MTINSHIRFAGFEFLKASWIENPKKKSLQILLESFEYSNDLRKPDWTFPVDLETLFEFGLNENDLRWLCAKGFLAHNKLATKKMLNLELIIAFSDESQFVLTEAGAEFARQILGKNQVSTAHSQAVKKPIWVKDRRILLFDGKIVKRFKARAKNQEKVLCAFQEEAWPFVVPDPLPPKADIDPKRRLHDTIKALNGKHENYRIKFHGDGSGEAVRWEDIS